ncbi:FimB/Mfa2 family fimbrial subunit [Bacteroides helcogenes]|uniref:Uncharacterized protein n=1 Tax=Bacteroides helcogenes (strain ATCC 35417 / DSM 20613 / JCM 6297 / CCUG 15421 / P 36-108) TaxID=693979 RepID=E6SVE5_BACT6|nr:FimB/Mfa2 family fimbrial subunit [Bacteroides helcogenes]ADV42455.1 protein of unknown function DUF1812 [Bacteroides helcogenes P 36-108]MDY5237787.1 FimB/Mfa2 family fimbrial subunit [Bacteroides helcogenes]
MERIQKRMTENGRSSRINAVRKTVFSACAAVITLAAVFLQTACVKDELYNTPHPDKGAVQITTDWTGRSSDAVLPESYILRIGSVEPATRSTGGEEQTVSGETNLFKSLLTPSTQHLLVYHQADGITINGTTATVNTLEDGTLNPMPGFLFSAAKELTIPKDDTLKVTVPMMQHIRTLTLTLKLNNGDEQRIAGTTATLTGIAPSVDLTTGNVAATEGKAVVPVFTLGTAAYGKARAGTSASPSVACKTTRATGNPVLAASLRLLGVMTGEKQELNIAVALTNGTVQTIKTDLTEALKNFGSGEIEPLFLDATLTLPAELGVSATISDWNTVDNGGITVN